MPNLLSAKEADGTKGEFVNVNTRASTFDTPSNLTSARWVPVKRRVTESRKGNRSIHLKTLDPPFTSLSTSFGKKGRPNTDALSACRRVRLYCVVLLNHKALKSAVLAVRRGLEICMQSAETT
jgi:hypothetical protein